MKKEWITKEHNYSSWWSSLCWLWWWFCDHIYVRVQWFIYLQYVQFTERQLHLNKGIKQAQQVLHKYFLFLLLMYEDFSKRQKWRRIWTVWRGTHYLWKYLMFRKDGRTYQGFMLLELSRISLLPSKAQRIHSAIKMQRINTKEQTPRTAQLERYNIKRRNPRCPWQAGRAGESPAVSTAVVSSVPVESRSSCPMLIPDQQSPDQSCVTRVPLLLWTTI